MQDKYQHKNIENKVQRNWETNKTFSVKKNKKEKYYCLSMFPCLGKHPSPTKSHQFCRLPSDQQDDDKSFRR